jgi:putative restriction endonuclease
MRAVSLLQRVEKVNVYKKRNERAPNKPLNLLLFISEMQKGKDRLIPFHHVDKILGVALRRFGLPTKSVSPKYSFWRLQNDKIAEVVPHGPYQLRKGNIDPTKESLIQMNASGGFLEEDFQLLKKDIGLQSLVVHKLLDNHFPRSIHEDILDFFDIRISSPRVNDDSSEREFRDRVIEAYNGICAITGYSVIHSKTFPGLEAAHICWQQVGGNDMVSNGIAMNTLMRKLFHLGLFTVDDDLRVKIAEGVVDHSSHELFSGLKNKRIRVPKRLADQPDKMALAWHRKSVFRG